MVSIPLKIHQIIHPFACSKEVVSSVARETCPEQRTTVKDQMFLLPTPSDTVADESQGHAVQIYHQVAEKKRIKYLKTIGCYLWNLKWLNRICNVQHIC